MTTMIRWAMVLACAGLSACGKGGGGQDGAGAPSPTENAAQTVADPATAQNTPAAVPAAPPAAFAVCSSCHAVVPGRNGVGPSLAGVWQRKAGSMGGYTYSEALKGSGIVWDAQTLDRWLQGPMQMVPGTKMVIGLPNPEARKAVIEYLETLK